MKKVLAPDWDPRRDYDAIVAAKLIEGRQELLKIRQTVHRAYVKYRRRARAHELHRVRPSRRVKPNIAKLLEHCYESPTIPLKDLKRLLRERLDESKCRHCPYCGFGEIATFDHYLPMSLFPEFSVCADNLVPCCWRCNHLRGDRDWTRGRGPSVIHVFHEQIDEDDASLCAIFDIGEKKLVVAFRVDEDDTRPFSCRFKRHFEVLDLARRFSIEAVGEIEELLEKIATVFQRQGNSGMADMVAQRCADEADAGKVLRGPNHWKTAFYRAAAASPTLVDYLVRRGGCS